MISEMKIPQTPVVIDHSGQRPSILASMIENWIEPGVSSRPCCVSARLTPDNAIDELERVIREALRQKLAKWLGGDARHAELKPGVATLAPQQLPLLDADALNQLTGGDTSLAHDLLTAFVDSLAGERAAVRHDLDGHQPEALRRSLHRLLGACRSACLPRLAQRVDALQEHARRGEREPLLAEWPALVTLIAATASSLDFQLTETHSP